ncbi:hypothetical protein YM3MPS_29980 [Mycobacterium pseudoshottsii]|nr:hypothetical protein YM3MPS_29980 [Mycobacterium pseudoshottsii]
MIGGTVMMALANERDLDAAWMDHTTTLLLGGLAR